MSSLITLKIYVYICININNLQRNYVFITVKKKIYIYEEISPYQNRFAVIDIHVGDEIRPYEDSDIPVQGVMGSGGDVSIIGGKLE